VTCIAGVNLGAGRFVDALATARLHPHPPRLPGPVA
jgi:hypothetical protein